MAFFRFSRDKRGYEHFYLVEPVANRRGKSRPRVLYWFRTPPNIRIGREPFDEDVRRALEAQNPNVAFDWRKIVEAPIPSAEADKWRERRRAERAARHASRGVTPAEEEETALQDEMPADDAGEPAAESEPSIPTVVESAAASVEAPSRAPGEAPPERAARRRRRRRRGRGAMGGSAPAPPAAPPAAAADADGPHSPSGDEPEAPNDVEPSGE